MVYWIELVRTEAGLTALQTIEWEQANFDPIAAEEDLLREIELSSQQRLGWQRICERFAALLGDVEIEQFNSHVGAASRDPRIRLEYTGSSATIRVPYWYEGQVAAEVISAAYALGRIIEDETLLVGVDSQTGSNLNAANVESAIAAYGGTRASALKTLAERDE